MTYIEGTANKLIEDNGVVVGVQCKPKGEDETKVFIIFKFLGFVCLFESL